MRATGGRPAPLDAALAAARDELWLVERLCVKRHGEARGARQLTSPARFLRARSARQTRSAPPRRTARTPTMTSSSACERMQRAGARAGSAPAPLGKGNRSRAAPRVSRMPRSPDGRVFWHVADRPRPAPRLKSARERWGHSLHTAVFPRAWALLAARTAWRRSCCDVWAFIFLQQQRQGVAPEARLPSSRINSVPFPLRRLALPSS